MNLGGKGKLVFGVFAFLLSSLVAILFIFRWFFMCVIFYVVCLMSMLYMELMVCY